MERPFKFERMGHVAIQVADVERAAKFYRDVLGLEPAWKVDPDWTILTCGRDDLALIRKGPNVHHPPHFGLRVASLAEVDAAYEAIKDKVKIVKEPKLHRDGSKSFYFDDPDGNPVEVIFDPNR
ncbi:MAG: VOC family protein [Verrucomicrobiae bacterium]|nr:VOC family protein [Verrucomicrobiae bacterium]